MSLETFYEPTENWRHYEDSIQQKSQLHFFLQGEGITPRASHRPGQMSSTPAELTASPGCQFLPNWPPGFIPPQGEPQKFLLMETGDRPADPKIYMEMLNTDSRLAPLDSEMY